MKNESDIFKLYYAPDNVRLVLTSPFVQDGHVIASDGHILIRVSQSATEDMTYPQAKSIKTDHLFAIEMPNEESITIERLEEMLSTIEQVEETVMIDSRFKCTECDGNGDVTWYYEHWTRRDDCPVCDGSGYLGKKEYKPTGRKIPDDKAEIQLGNKAFSAKYIKVIADTMKLLGVSQLTMRYSKSGVFKQAIFNLTPDVDVLLMPLLK
jgi:hypothetical protein